MIPIHGASPPSKPKNCCSGCGSDDGTSIEMAFAFQPIVDLRTGDAYAHEALLRGPNGEPAATVLTQVDEANRYRFDQPCRTTAIEQAAMIGMDTFLSINFMPNALYQPAACIRTTFDAAEKFGFPIHRIILETIEGEDIINRPHLLEIFRAYQSFGFQTAIDDFGAGHSGLTLLTDFQPDMVKLDMALIRGIDSDVVCQRNVCGVLCICSDVGIRVIAEGVETAPGTRLPFGRRYHAHARLSVRQAGVQNNATRIKRSLMRRAKLATNHSLIAQRAGRVVKLARDQARQNESAVVRHPNRGSTAGDCRDRVLISLEPENIDA